MGICSECGLNVHIGMWPFCHGDPTKHLPAVANVIGDEIPGGQVIENLGNEPITFYSKHAIAQEANRRGLRLRDQWAGPSDKYLTNWAAGIDAQTLANARALLEHRQRGTTSDPARLETLEVSIRRTTL